MANIFNTEDSVFFVGGPTTQVGNALAGGCTKAWYDANFVNLLSIMTNDGSPLIEVTGGTPSGGNTLTKAGAFANAEVGMVAYLSGTNVPDTGRYKILTVPDSDTITFDAGTFDGTTADVVCNIGGAFDSLQNASDDTTAANHNVIIFTNKDEDLRAASTIDFDVGGGNESIDTWKRIIGIDNNGDVLTGSLNNAVSFNGYGTITGDDILDVSVSNVHLKRLSTGSTKGTGAGLKISSSGVRYNTKVEGCTLDGYYGYYNTSFSHNGVEFINCKFEGTRIFSSNLKQHVFKNCTFSQITGNGVDIQKDSTFTGCTFFLGSYGIYKTGDGRLTVQDCSFHGQTVSGIYLNHSSGSVSVTNCIFDEMAISDKAIEINAGSMSFADYNCAYSSFAGAPLTTPWPEAYGSHENSIEDDPQFVSATDFRLKPGSPCLNTGKSTLEDGYISMGAWQKKQGSSRSMETK